MQVKIEGGSCEVTRGPTDKRLYSESQLLHQVKVELKRQGHDVIKKEMVKDGHLVSEGIYYLRQRHGKWAVWNSGYQIYDAAQDYNKNGYTSLNVEVY